MEKLTYTLPTPTAKLPQTLPANCSKSAATKSANLLLGSYLKSEFNDPEIFTRRLVELFMDYPEQVVADVAKKHPLLAKWLHLSDLKEACDLRSRTTREATHWDRVVRETIARRVKPVECEAPCDGDRLATERRGAEVGREVE